jgi:cytochrome b6-f complex iron-sulfur subunit
MRGITRYIEDLLRSRRPRAFRADPDEAALAQVAITLRAARPGSGAPTEEFVTGLHKRLAAELEPGPDRTGPDRTGPARPRRAFVRAASVAAGAAAAGAGLDQLLARPGAVTGAANRPAPGGIDPDRGSWQAILASADLPDGAVHPFTLTTLTGFVERAGGRLRAVSGICTHQGCRLELADAATELACPCHGATFALDGAVLRHRLSVQLTALPRIAVRESGGVVQVYAPRSGAAGPSPSAS